MRGTAWNRYNLLRCNLVSSIKGIAIGSETLFEYHRERYKFVDWFVTSCPRENQGEADKDATILLLARLALRTPNLELA